MIKHREYQFGAGVLPKMWTDYGGNANTTTPAKTLMNDATIVKLHDGLWHLYGIKQDSAHQFEHAIHHFTSTNLRDWTQHPDVLNADDYPDVSQNGEWSAVKYKPRPYDNLGVDAFEIPNSYRKICLFCNDVIENPLYGVVAGQRRYVMANTVVCRWNAGNILGQVWQRQELIAFAYSDDGFNWVPDRAAIYYPENDHAGAGGDDHWWYAVVIPSRVNAPDCVTYGGTDYYCHTDVISSTPPGTHPSWTAIPGPASGNYPAWDTSNPPDTKYYASQSYLCIKSGVSATYPCGEDDKWHLIEYDAGYGGWNPATNYSQSTDQAQWRDPHFYYHEPTGKWWLLIAARRHIAGTDGALGLARLIWGGTTNFSAGWAPNAAKPCIVISSIIERDGTPAGGIPEGPGLYYINGFYWIHFFATGMPAYSGAFLQRHASMDEADLPYEYDVNDTRSTTWFKSGALSSVGSGWGGGWMFRWDEDHDRWVLINFFTSTSGYSEWWLRHNAVWFREIDFATPDLANFDDGLNGVARNGFPTLKWIGGLDSDLWEIMGGDAFDDQPVWNDPAKYAYNETPARYRDSSDTVNYNGRRYQCIGTHVSELESPPDIATTRWTDIGSASATWPDWQPGYAYRYVPGQAAGTVTFVSATAGSSGYGGPFYGSRATGAGGMWHIDTFENRQWPWSPPTSPQWGTPVGWIRSKPFTLEGDRMSLYVGGGLSTLEECFVGLLDENDRLIFMEYGSNSHTMTKRLWDTSSLIGSTVRLVVVDNSTDRLRGWISCDRITEYTKQGSDLDSQVPVEPTIPGQRPHIQDLTRGM